LEIVESLETLHISARRLKFFRVDVDHVPKTLSWYFTTDGDIYFGIFYEVSYSNNLREINSDLAPRCATQNWRQTCKRGLEFGLYGNGKLEDI
jgi:hypothetical protein